MTVKKRNSNYEFLRILAMILITLNHITTKGLSLNPAAGSGANNALALLYTCGGKFGCILFLLISAWFLSDREINWKQILIVWVQTFVYYLLFNVIGMAVNHSFTKTGLLRSFFPLLFSNYWYSRCYIILLLCFPFLMKAFRLIPFKKTLLFAGAGFMLLPVLFPSGGHGAVLDLLCKICRQPIVAFFYYSVLLRYIKNHVPYRKLPFGAYMALFLLLFAAMWALTVRDFYRAGSFFRWRDIYSPFSYLSAFCLFLGVSVLPASYHGSVNFLAKLCFGIYLFQCHAQIKPILWNAVFPFETWFGMPLWSFLPRTLLAGFAILLIGAFISLLYEYVLGRPVTDLLSKIGAAKDRAAKEA